MQIRNEGYRLQSGEKDALLNSLLLAVKRFSSGPPQVSFFICIIEWFNQSWCAPTVFTEILIFFKQLLTQICLALSTLVLHAAEHGKPIQNIWYCLQNLQSQHNGSPAALEVLTVLPEIIEDHNSDSSMTSAQRYEYGQEVFHSDQCDF